MEFNVGDAVQKATGDYKFPGHVMAVVTKKSGQVRYVVEDDRGQLHIFNEQQLEPAKAEQSALSGGERAEVLAALDAVDKAEDGPDALYVLGNYRGARRKCRALAARLRSAPSEVHDYLSTACLHNMHDQCRQSCKFCGAECRCVCHATNETAPSPAPEQRAEPAALIERLRILAKKRSEASGDMMYVSVLPEQTDEWKAADLLSALPHPAPAAGFWLAPDELTQPMLNAAGFTAEDASNRKRWAAFKKAAPPPPQRNVQQRTSFSTSPNLLRVRMTNGPQRIPSRCRGRR